MSSPILTACGAPSALPADLIQSYQNAVFGFATDADGTQLVHEFMLDIPAEPLAALARRTGHFEMTLITAANPESVTLSVAQNASRHAALVADVEERGLSALPGYGRDAQGVWPREVSLLVLGISFDTACAIGRTHGQDAIVWSDNSFVPRLVLLC